MSKKCGYVALIGAPNAGKSTLLNALLRKKISIVSNKPQTTRTRVLGVLVKNQSQMIFLDTPGLAQKAKPLAQSVWDACSDADIICYLIDCTRNWSPEDTITLQKLNKSYPKPLLILGTKTDKIKKHELLKIKGSFQDQFENLALSNAKLMFLSAKKPEDLKILTTQIGEYLPKSEWYYEPETVTDSSDTFMSAEFIREQIFRQLGDEIPYQVSVDIEHFHRKPHLVEIHAIIKVVRESQKAILIGKGGARLKAIGQMARESLEKFLNQKVYLKIFIKKGEV